MGACSACVDDGRLQECVPHPVFSLMPISSVPVPLRSLNTFSEIGIGLTGAGFLFMLLGVLMFFDKGLLAMGNVCRRTSFDSRSLEQSNWHRPPPSHIADTISFWGGDDNRCKEDIQILFSEEEGQGDCLLSWWYSTRLVWLGSNR